MTSTESEKVVEDEPLVLACRPRPRYGLADLLARCAPEAELSAEDFDWTSAGPVGGEAL